MNLYKKVVLPSTLYGCEIWNELKSQDYQLLNKFQHFIVKDIQGLKTSTRSDMCESLVGLRPITSEIDKKKLLFFEKLCNFSHDILVKKIFLFRLFTYLNDKQDKSFGYVKDIYSQFFTNIL